MVTNVTFRHFNGQHPELREMAIDHANGFEKFFDNIISTNVEFINESEKTVYIKVHVQGNTLFAKEGSDDFKKSLGIASDKMVRQLKKWKTKRLAKKY